MLVFSDLHWTDEMSLEVIGEMARHAADRPLLLVGGLPRLTSSRPTASTANGGRASSASAMPMRSGFGR